MVVEPLLAKSARQSQPQTILEHTAHVLSSAEALMNATGEHQLRALGLDPKSWLSRLRCEIRLAAFLHDLGKANDHFQNMIRGVRLNPQAIRHESVSYWIANRPEIQDWIRPVFPNADQTSLVLWAVAGHHRKFPPPDPANSDVKDVVNVFLGHPDFRSTLIWGARLLKLGDPPFLADATLQFTRKQSVIREFEEDSLDAGDLMRRMSPEEKRFLALLKACLICADVAGSIGRKGGKSMVEWIGEAFENVPSVEQLDGVVALRRGDSPLRPFQMDVGAQTDRVVYVRAGCGSGKTLAAYHWAARWSERLDRGLRVIFCYPTMGTATEGYRDYLKDSGLDAALVHGRAEIDMEMLRLGDDESDQPSTDRPEDQPGRASNDSVGALDQWSTPIVSCTVDTVLGLIQNNRRGIFAWPTIAGSALVFDEIHSYDDALFAALLRFLTEVRGIHCLLMTASLPSERLDKIKAVLASLGERLGEVPGPEELETLNRYRRDVSTHPWDRAEAVLEAGGKVLWVVNTVDQAMTLYDDPRAKAAGAILYHSRFRYVDRVRRHKAVIDAFHPKNKGRALAITTQVAEMSLDLSANLLISQLAPISSIIQRLGRLNRFAKCDDPWPFLIYEPDPPPPGYPLPYTAEQLTEAREWLGNLGEGPLSQRSLIDAWKTQPSGTQSKKDQFIWFDGGFVTEPRPLREASPGIEVILKQDADGVRAGRPRPEEVRIPMPMPRDRAWPLWPEVAFCKVPPEDLIEYDQERGARWIR